MLSPMLSFVKEMYFGKFQGHSYLYLNFKNILHFKTASNWSVKLAKFEMSQLLIPRICRVWFRSENVPWELSTIGSSGDVK